MKQDEIIEMANKSFDESSFTDAEVLRFARLVAAKEREAIWNILFEYAGRDDLTLEDESLLKHLADLLRAREHKGAVE